jgi:hypothetical protein
VKTGIQNSLKTLQCDLVGPALTAGTHQVDAGAIHAGMTEAADEIK